MNNDNSTSSGCSRRKKNGNYGVQLLLKRPFRLVCFVLLFFLEIHDVVKFSDVLKGNSLLSFHKS